MVDQWMQNFSHWEPNNQMVFSCVVLLAGFTLLVLAGWWGLGLWRLLWEGLGICCKGYPPPEKDEEPNKPSAQVTPVMLPVRAVVPDKTTEIRTEAKRLLALLQRLRSNELHVAAADDVCANPLNPTGHCLEQRHCATDTECRRAVEQFIDPEQHAEAPCGTNHKTSPGGQ